jgi:hypothetical protein
MTAVAEPEIEETTANEPEETVTLESLSLTPADLDNLSDEQITAKLEQLQLYQQRMRSRVRANTAKARRIEKSASTVGALVSRMNDVARAEYKQAQATARLDKARNTFSEVQSAYLRVNEISEIPAEVQEQLNAAREATMTKLQSAASRVKADDADSGD